MQVWNKWFLDSFNEEISNAKHLFMKNMYLSYWTDKQVKRLFKGKFYIRNCNAVKEIKATLFNKLPHIVSFSNNTEKKFKELLTKFCKNYDTNIVFSQSCYIGNIKCHLPSRINEHLVTDKNSHFFIHL